MMALCDYCKPNSIDLLFEISLPDKAIQQLFVTNQIRPTKLHLSKISYILTINVSPI